MKDKFIKFLVLVPGLIMLSNAIMFVLRPADVAGDLGMPLLEGIGLSTQLADLGAFFTFSALLIFYGVIYSKGEYLRITAQIDYCRSMRHFGKCYGWTRRRNGGAGWHCPACEDW